MIQIGTELTIRNFSSRVPGWITVATGCTALGFAFPPFPLPWLAWVAYALIFVGIIRADQWRAAAVWAVGGFLITYAIAGSWVLSHPDPYTQASSAVGMLWMATTSAVPVVVSYVFFRRLGLFGGLLGLISAQATLELMQFRLAAGFPWAAIGHTQAAFAPFNQIADIGGTGFLSIWVLSLNACFAAAWMRDRQTRRGAILAATVLIAGSAGYGSWRIADLAHSWPTVSVLAIQPAMSAEQWADQASPERVPILMTMTTDALKDTAVDLVVWPETALPTYVRGEIDSAAMALQRFVDEIGVPLMTGAVEFDRSVKIGTPYANVGLLYSGHSKPPDIYRKRRLVPFAEAVPYAERFPVLHRFAVPSGGVWGYRPGREPGLLTAGQLKVGVMICFESVFGYLNRELTMLGAQFLVVPTQDGWWGRSLSYEQHMAFNRLRAIETRRALLQVSVSGITGLITPDGRAVATTEWMKPVARRYEIPISSIQTFYTRFGDWPWIATLIILLILILRVLIPRPDATPK